MNLSQFCPGTSLHHRSTHPFKTGFTIFMHSVMTSPKLISHFSITPKVPNFIRRSLFYLDTAFPKQGSVSVCRWNLLSLRDGIDGHRIRPPKNRDLSNNKTKINVQNCDGYIGISSLQSHKYSTGAFLIKIL
jgi:hypothetical protein